ncbi:MAG TPA: 3-phosphoshikimate 1-carboxyvinyltransferase [Opitutaceae bacterium]|nr:3-phosphoshikimate 1-carboxyvinyltransferase [Opitutaceae bacterium]
MTPLPDVLPIKPFTRPARGEVTLPGSKSITNRALLLAALCDGPVTLTGALFSEDTEIMAESLRRLGFTVKEDQPGKTISVEGRGGQIPNEKAELFVGNAGTAARFLTALCAAAPRGVYKLDGVPQMRKRPMKGLIDALRRLGAEIRCLEEEGFFPLEIYPHGLKELSQAKIDSSESSQLLSALLMVAPLSHSGVFIELSSEVRRPFVRMTTKIMEDFGILIMREYKPKELISIRSGNYRLGKKHYSIEPDASAASYFLTLPLITSGNLNLPGLHGKEVGLQGDIRFIDVLCMIGEKIDEGKGYVAVEFSPNEKRRGLNENFREFSDTFLTLAAISPLLEGTTTITGIAHTRKQETDRVAGAARELKKLGQDVVEEEDSLTLTPNLNELRKRAAEGMIEIETYNDHRFAMSFAILGCHDLLGNGRPWLAIKNPACCAKTFPNFFDVLEQVWKNSHQ